MKRVPLLFITALALLLFASVVYAQGFTPLAPIEAGDAGGESFLRCTEPEIQDKQCLPKYLRTIYNTGVALAGLFLVFSIVRGGFTLMFTDSILGKLEGKKIILQALGGAVIVYSSYLLMNFFNPQLGRDLNLSLDFPRVIIQDVPVVLKPFTLTEQQLAGLKEKTEKFRTDAGKEIAKLQDEVVKLKTDLADSRTRGDTEEIVQFTDAIETREGRIAELNLAVKGTSEERLVALQGMNAQSAADAMKNLTDATKAGGSIAQIHSAYTEYRAATRGDPTVIIQSYTDEFNRISVIQKALAFGMIENPPAGASRAGSLGETELQNQVTQRIQAIKDERRKQVNALIDLNAATNNPVLNRAIQAQDARIKLEAQNQICQIKNLCIQKDYACKDLERGVQC